VEAATIERKLDPGRRPATLGNLGGLLHARGEFERADALLDEAVAIAEQYAMEWHLEWILDIRGAVAARLGDLDRARRCFSRSLALHRQLQDPRMVAKSLERCAELATILADGVRVARLLGCASAIRETIGVPMHALMKMSFDRFVPAARSRVDDEAWERAWSGGRALSAADAIEYALSGLLHS
jgi:tetratricopeptide (TPR) repeat protein